MPGRHNDYRVLYQIAVLHDEGNHPRAIARTIGRNRRDTEGIITHLKGSEGDPTLSLQAGAILHYIFHHSFIDDTKHAAPTAAEVARACGIQADQAAEHIDHLKLQGYINVLPSFEEDPPGTPAKSRRGRPETGSDLIDPGHWEGPISSLLTELWEFHTDDTDQQDHADIIISVMLQKNTTRILLSPEQTDELLAITAHPGTKPSWSYPDPVYLEFQPAVTTLNFLSPTAAARHNSSSTVSGDVPGTIHGFFITPDPDSAMINVLVPVIMPSEFGVKILAIDTADWTSPDRAQVPQDGIDFVRNIVELVTSPARQVIELPLSRNQQRRLRRAKQTNPWHIILDQA